MSEPLRYQIGLNEEQDVLIDFGGPVRFVVLEPEHALQLAELLIKRAKKSTKHKGEKK